MKTLIYLFLLVPVLFLNAQKIGKLAEEKPHINFPNNSLGLDIMIGEGGFGLGGFYRYEYTNEITGFVDVSISESKSEREIQRFNIWGYPLPIEGKVNRVFMVPLNFGIHYRMFYNTLTDNLRPYLNVGVGPTLIVSTPAQEEFFNSFGSAKTKFGFGGYVGLGANIGNNTSNLTGVNIRYYLHKLFGGGIEQYAGDFKNTLGQVTLTITIGFMY
ncbi:MAG: hypothetical protein V3V16_07385 [Melioribacteraceae bacterium]